MDNLFTSLLAAVVDLSPLPDVNADQNRVGIILTVIFTSMGAIALLIITIAGFRYVISAGDPNAVAQSKRAIIYALVGLVVSISAVTIVNFVVGNI